MHCSNVSPGAAIAILIFLAGCASPIIQLSEQSGLYEKVKGNAELAKQFLSCSRQAYGGSSSRKCGCRSLNSRQ